MMRKGYWIALLAPGVLALVACVFVVSLLLIKALWAWTVPDLFPGAVEQGLIARDITWMAALKLAIFTSVIVGMGRSTVRERSCGDR